MGSPQTGEPRVKIDVDSGAAATLVPEIQCTHPRSRARARLGQTYDSGGADQGQFIQFWRQKIMRVSREGASTTWCCSRESFLFSTAGEAEAAVTGRNQTRLVHRRPIEVN